MLEPRQELNLAGESFGLDRFRDATVVSLSEQQGLSNSRVFSVLADRNGTVWVGTANGLTRMKGGRVKDSGLLTGIVQSLFEDHRGRVER